MSTTEPAGKPLTHEQREDLNHYHFDTPNSLRAAPGEQAGATTVLPITPQQIEAGWTDILRGDPSIQPSDAPFSVSPAVARANAIQHRAAELAVQTVQILKGLGVGVTGE